MRPLLPAYKLVTSSGRSASRAAAAAVFRYALVLSLCISVCGRSAAQEDAVQEDTVQEPTAGDTAIDSAATAAQVEFFEAKIRPILVEHCDRCHGPAAVEKDQLKGGLRVDTRQGLLAGGDSGPAVVPGNVDESLLIDALRYDSFEMPPEGKLPPQVIRDFEQWIRQGAHDPREATSHEARRREIDIQAGRAHWAYQPVPADVAIPEAAYHGSSPVDAFINARLSTAGIEPSGEADRETLVRRLYYDLTGLPPSPEQLEAFINDPSPLAYQRLVERLLASPEFGRHWGRHWLDIVRYAESVTLRGLVQHNAWRYRDYVIDAWNEDRPYDQFLREQIAGDLMAQASPEAPLRHRQQQHIATTFLTMTNANLEDQDKEKLRMDVVDEQLNVIGKAFLAQTLGCARCHDHKFDPIPTRDYYALAGILRNVRTLEESNVSRWLDLPLPLPPEQERQIREGERQVKQLESQLAALKKKLNTKPTKNAVPSNSLAGFVVDDEAALFEGTWVRSTSIPIYVDAGYQHDDNQDQGNKSATFSMKLPRSGKYEVRMSYTASSNRTSKAEVTVWSEDGSKTQSINQRRKPPIDGLFVSLGEFTFSADEPARVVISNRGSDGVVIVDVVQFLPLDPGSPDGKRPQVANAADDAEARAEREAQAELQDQVKRLQQSIAKIRKSLPQRPQYMGVVAWEEIGDMPIHIRGNVHNHGSVVPRGFLQVATYSTAPKIAEDRDGRLELANWLTDETNPLPARVMVNRIWHWLFGNGLVRSTDNFGIAGEEPSHPELLDYLARDLMDHQWSLKSTIRGIVTSDAYRRSSATNSVAAQVDPENRLLWRMNRRRLEAEAIQDAILFAAGQLDHQHGGSDLPGNLGADYDFQFESRRRAIYWPMLRNSIPDLIATFDGADPSLVVGKRTVSNVATQALFMMNHPWVIQQSELAAERLLKRIDGTSDTTQGIDLAFRQILGRAPTREEEQAAIDFVGSDQPLSDSERLQRWTMLIQSLFSTIDFRFRY